MWIDAGRVVNVRAVGRWFNPGLMFDTSDGLYDGVIVWLFRTRRSEALDQLTALGWRV